MTPDVTDDAGDECPLRPAKVVYVLSRQGKTTYHTDPSCWTLTTNGDGDPPLRDDTADRAHNMRGLDPCKECVLDVETNGAEPGTKFATKVRRIGDEGLPTHTAGDE